MFERDLGFAEILTISLPFSKRLYDARRCPKISGVTNPRSLGRPTRTPQHQQIVGGCSRVTSVQDRGGRMPCRQRLWIISLVKLHKIGSYILQVDEFAHQTTAACHFQETI
ncbi:uncharacterized protein [Triticum aestivum]|uniref:uncharacterized protein n=1 Tax=Triticum aestivum TaxID=4565 RepID=UPI001D021DD3|nr:uncharacterized protein LOC123167800 [Triticum aestivum]